MPLEMMALPELQKEPAESSRRRPRQAGAAASTGHRRHKTSQTRMPEGSWSSRRPSGFGRRCCSVPLLGCRGSCHRLMISSPSTTYAAADETEAQ